MANWLRDMLDFIIKAKQIELQQQQINSQEIAMQNTQGVQHMLLQAQLASSKQTLEVIELTRIISILTVALVAIGAIQIFLLLVQIAVMTKIV
jgi:hypothetical protein